MPCYTPATKGRVELRCAVLQALEGIVSSVPADAARHADAILAAGRANLRHDPNLAGGSDDEAGDGEEMEDEEGDGAGGGGDDDGDDAE
jgi:hypothetical protein